MKNKVPKVLVIGPSRKTRGGITSVLKEYERSNFWFKNKCKWIGTHIDRGYFMKMLFFVKSFISYLLCIPFYNIVHIHFSWSVSAYRKYFFFLVARLLHKKIIIHLHSGAEPIINSKGIGIYKHMFKKADMSIFLADCIKKEIEAHFEIRKHKIIYNPCLTPIIGHGNNIINKDFSILFAGTVTKKKGTHDLIKAFSKITKRHSQWKLIMAGNGDIEQNKQLAKELGIGNKVDFLGWVSGAKKDNLFRKASLFCLPSYTEGFPMSVLDAWAYGLPVVTTPVGGLPDVIIHEKNAMIFNPGDIKTLSENLEKLMKSESLRNEIVKQSFLLSKDLFNVEKISHQISLLYHQIVK